MRIKEIYDQGQEQEVDEIIGIKKFHHLELKDAVKAIAKSIGGRILGDSEDGGYFAQAVETPQNPNVVYKIIEQDDAYLKFAKFSMEHTNKHYPKIYKIRSMTSFFKRFEMQVDKFVVMDMEKLYKLETADLYRRLLDFRNDAGKPTRLPNGLDNDKQLTIREICDTDPEFKGLWDAAQQIRTRLMTTPDVGWDLHAGNIMRRKDGTVVITDPIVNEAGFKYAREVQRLKRSENPPRAIQGPKYLQKIAKKPENLVSTVLGAKKRIAQLEIKKQNGEELDAEDSLALTIFKRMVKHEEKNNPPKEINKADPNVGKIQNDLAEIVKNAKKRADELINKRGPLTTTEHDQLQALQRMIRKHRTVGM